MKKYERFKALHLAVLVVLAAVSLILIFTDKDLFHIIANDSAVRRMAALLWLCLLAGFLFALTDYSWMARFKKEYKELDIAVSSDSLTGLANRNSCDAVIESYYSQPLPEHLACITIQLTSLKSHNALQGRSVGNAHLQHFSTLLQAAARQQCFVGRNGGMCFLAIFRDGDQAQIDAFLQRVQTDVANFNQRLPEQTISYCYGVAIQSQEHAETITQLVSLSHSRCNEVSL